MNDVNNRIFREFTEFFDNVEKNASEISVTMASGTISGCKIIFWIFFTTCGLALAIHWPATFPQS